MIDNGGRRAAVGAPALRAVAWSQKREKAMQVVLAEILGPDLLIVLAIVALLFGSSQLPKLARSLGSAKSEFEKGIRHGHDQEESSPPEDQVTMSKSELDALLDERERSVRPPDHPAT
jgi:sec-independent protein translocase protein TatA